MNNDIENTMKLRLLVSPEATARMRRFTEQGMRGLAAMRREVKQLHADFNGFSAATKLFDVVGGFAAVRSTLHSNFSFERDILEMKQKSGMLKEQADELRQLAISSAETSLQTPQEILLGMKAFSRAGEQFESIKIKIVDAARAATVFRTSVEKIANLDFNLTDKLKIDPTRLNRTHNMLYYHSKAGRFNAPQLARQASGLSNQTSAIGIEGEQGLNFTGAMIQVLGKSASVNNPEQAKATMQQGLGNILSPDYVKGLRKFGINIEKFISGGKFRGEGGVEGLLELADAMKEQGLEGQLKSGQAGFKNKDANKFILALMENSDTIRSEMATADLAAKNDWIGTDFAEIKHANFGKIKAAEIQIEKLKLSGAARKSTSFVGNLAGKLADDPAVAVKGGLGLAGGYLLYKKYRKDKLASKMGMAGDIVGVAGVQKVFVTNWSGGKQLRKNYAQRNGTIITQDGNGKLRNGGGKLNKVGKVLNKAAGLASAGIAGYTLGYEMIGPLVRDGLDAAVSALSGEETRLGLLLYDFFNKQQEPTKVIVEVQNGDIVASVEQHQNQIARRN